MFSSFNPTLKIILKSWEHFQKNRGIVFYAFMIMPSHLHYTVQPTDEKYSIVDMQRDFKKFTAKRILDGLNYELEHGMFPVVEAFKNRPLNREPAAELIQLFQKIGKYRNQSHKVWMSDEKPEAIHSEDFMIQKINYIHFNPVKSELVKEPQEYPFSSARNYYLEDDSLFTITKIGL
jgi:REP element-mobilizing transposase RayT